MIILEIDHDDNTTLLLEGVEVPYRPSPLYKRKIVSRRFRHRPLWQKRDEIIWDRCYSAKDKAEVIKSKTEAKKRNLTIFKYVLKAEIREWIIDHLTGVVILKVNSSIKLFFRNAADMIAFKLRWL